MAGGRVESNLSAAAVGGTASVEFNGPGDGYILITSIVVSSTVRTPRPECSVYRGTVNPGALMAYSRDGGRKTFTGQDDRIYPSDKVIIVWTGLGAGAVVTARLTGVSG